MMTQSTKIFPPSLLDTELASWLLSALQITKLPVLFEDSTNQLWSMQTTEQHLVLKLCHTNMLETSPFWQAMTALFGLSHPESMGRYAVVYQQIQDWSSLAVPELRACASQQLTRPGYLLTEWVQGEAVVGENISELMLRQLAQHLGGLHQQKQPQFGGLFNPVFDASAWQTRLRHTLATAGQGRLEAEKLLEVLEAVAFCRPASFVPIMPDLRWDQFLQQGGNLSCLVDLDALVWGPVELEWVLLEYLLTETQWTVFVAEYQLYQPIPILQEVRLPYRVLLFVMQVFGESDFNKWMQQPTRCP